MGLIACEGLSYSERLAHYYLEKMYLDRIHKDPETYESLLKGLAKKWRI